MCRPFTRRQRGQNSRFLAALARTGNARLAARTLGVHRATYTKRRARNPTFAADWDAALATAHAAFERAGGERPPESCPPCEALPRGEGDRVQRGGGAAGRDCQSRTRTLGGEPLITRTRNGRLQLRHAPPGRMTEAAAETFLDALAQTNNLRHAALCAGLAHSTLIARRRRSPAFAADMAEAEADASESIDRALRQPTRTLQSFLAEAPEWPKGMSVAQLLHSAGRPMFGGWDISRWREREARVHPPSAATVQAAVASIGSKERKPLRQ